MIITCEKCSTRYKLDVSAISNPVFKVRCAHCNHRFEVHKKLDIDSDFLQAENVDSSVDHKIISISNQKGGVAKTSTCLNMGMSLSMLNKRVLLVDFDVQANLTTSLDFPSNSLSFFDVLHSKTENISPYIHETKYDNLHLLPSNSRMALLSRHYMNKPNFELLLQDRLRWVSQHYDFILIDTPPSLGFCTLNALMASSYVIIPTPCEYLSMNGIHKIEEIIRVIQKKARQKIHYRILITLHDPESTASMVIYRKIQEKFQYRVLNTLIELDEKMKESQIVNLPVSQYDKKSISARQYTQLAREFIELHDEL